MKVLQGVLRLEGVFFLDPASSVIVLQKACQIRLALYCPLDTSLLMSPIPSIASFFSIACSMSMLMLAALVQAPEPQDNPAMLRQCMQLHPERYCRLTHAPSTVRAMESK